MSSTSETTLGPRVGAMMRLDFYRLFHTPVFYIMLAISALIPAMLLATSGSTGAESAQSATPAVVYTNAWQLVESTGGSAAGANPMDFGGYANINMVFIFAGLLMAIFVSHDYMSGFVKSIFTVHSKKMDYVISKSAIGIFSGAGMILSYLLGTIVAGLISGTSFDVNVAGLILCIIAKIFLMGVFCSLFLAIAVFFRDKLWITIVFTFLLGMMFYPMLSVATLSSTVVTVLGALVAGAVGALLVGSVSTLILSKRDLA
ncbi:MAG: ABC transporter permease [Propionibacterium sp.]